MTDSKLNIKICYFALETLSNVVMLKQDSWKVSWRMRISPNFVLTLNTLTQSDSVFTAYIT